MMMLTSVWKIKQSVVNMGPVTTQKGTFFVSVMQDTCGTEQVDVNVSKHTLLCQNKPLLSVV